MTKVHKATIIIWGMNHEVTKSEIEYMVEGADDILGKMVSHEEKDAGTWHDDHPLNKRMSEKELIDYFENLTEKDRLDSVIGNLESELEYYKKKRKELGQ